MQKKEKETRKTETKNWPDNLNFTRVDPTAIVILPGFNGSAFGWLDYLRDNTGNLMVEYSTEVDCLSCEQDKCKLPGRPYGHLAPGASHSE